jgi:hypothetical protein
LSSPFHDWCIPEETKPLPDCTHNLPGGGGKQSAQEGNSTASMLGSEGTIQSKNNSSEGPTTITLRKQRGQANIHPLQKVVCLSLVEISQNHGAPTTFFIPLESARCD